MIISIDDNLEELLNNLKKMGYDVHKLSESIDSDVIVYSGQSTHLLSLNSSAHINNSSPVFLIDGDNKRSDDIISMVKNRTYSSLF